MSDYDYLRNVDPEVIGALLLDFLGQPLADGWPVVTSSASPDDGTARRRYLDTARPVTHTYAAWDSTAVDSETESMWRRPMCRCPVLPLSPEDGAPPGDILDRIDDALGDWEEDAGHCHAGGDPEADADRWLADELESLGSEGGPATFTISSSPTAAVSLGQVDAAARSFLLYGNAYFMRISPIPDRARQRAEGREYRRRQLARRRRKRNR